MAASLGTIRGQMVLDVKQAIAAYTAVRLANLNTVTALHTGAGALMAAGASFGIFGGLVLAGFKVAADAAADFERQLSYFGAVTASTEEQMDAVRLKALQLGEDTIYSAGQIVDSFVELGKAGVTAEQIIGGVGEAVANLGAAADLPLDTAANIIMAAVQTFRLSAEDAVGVADMLAGAANASIIEVQDLGVSLKYAGGVAASFGIGLEETIDALGLLGTYGIRGSTAGTSLRQILVSLTGATGPATQKLKELGIITEDGTNKFFDAAGSAKPLAEIFQILQDATAGMGDAQRTATLKTIFQNRALAAAIALTKEGSAGFAEMNAEISKTTAAEVAAERLNNLSGDLEILRGNLETLAISQGSTFQDFLRGLVQGITDVIQWFADLDEGTQATIIKIVGIVAAVSIVVGALGLFAGAIMNVVALAIQLAPALSLLSKGITLVAGGFRALGMLMLTNPIGLIITAVIALVAGFIYLWNNVEGFRNFWIAVWDHIVTAFNAVVAWFQGIPAWWNELWTGVGQTVSTIWNNILAFFQSIPQRILNFFLNFTLPGLLIQHWDSIWGTIQTVWNNILNFFRELPGNIANFFSELPGKVGYWIGYMAGTVIRLLIEWGTNAWNTITDTWNNVLNFFKELPGKAEAFFIDMAVRILTWLIKTYNDARQKASDILNAIISFLQQLPGRVATFFTNVYNNVRDWMTNAYNQARQRASDILTGVVSFIQQLPGRILEFFTNIYNNIVNKFNDAKDRALDIAKNIYNGVRDAINGLPRLVTGIFNRVVDAIKGVVRRAFNAVRDFANGLWEGFKKGLGIASPSYIEHAIWAITGVLDEETQRMRGQVRAIQGLGNRINDIGAGMGDGFTDNMEAQIATVEQYLAQVAAQRDQLAAIGSTSTAALSTPSALGIGLEPLVINEGNTVTLDVEWNAAPNDEISTARQVKSLLGKSSTILGDELEGE